MKAMLAAILFCCSTVAIAGSSVSKHDNNNNDDDVPEWAANDMIAGDNGGMFTYEASTTNGYYLLKQERCTDSDLSTRFWYAGEFVGSDGVPHIGCWTRAGDSINYRHVYTRTSGKTYDTFVHGVVQTDTVSMNNFVIKGGEDCDKMTTNLRKACRKTQ